MTTASRTCDITGVWLSVDSSSCRYESDRTANLDVLHETPLSHSNIHSVAKEVTNLTSDHKLLQPDVNLAVNVIETIVKGRYSDNEAFRDIVTTAAQLAIVNVSTRQDGETTYNTSLRLVAALQDVARDYNIPAANASIPLIETDFVSLDTVEVQRGEFSGITYYESTSTSNGRKFQRSTLQAFKHGALDKRGLDVGIELPDSLLDHVSGLEPGSTTRVNFITYQTNNFFTDKSLADGGRVDNNTRVISAFVGNTSVYNLTDPATVVFTPLQPGYAPQCVFWDNNLNDGFGGWNVDGCTLVEDTTDFVSCECNHLTSFSVVFSLCSGNCPCESVSDDALSIISYVGCSLSMLGLSATIVCVLLAKCYRGRLINSVHITVNFCLALLLSIVFFFTIRSAVSSSAACTTVAAFLHFFMLSTFLWMMIEGMCMYRDLVIALGVDQSSTKFRNVAYTVGWGLSALLVLTLVAIQGISQSVAGSSSEVNATNESVTESFSGIEIYGAVEVYRDDDTEEADLSYCWINNTGVFLATFAVPALIIIWLNFFITIRIYFVLRSRSKMAARTITRRDKSNGRRMTAMVIVSLNLGVTWLFGAATLADYQAFIPDANGPDDATCTLITVFQYLFAIFNSLLGFLIFTFNVLLNNRMRYHLVLRFCPQVGNEKKDQAPAKEHKVLTLKFIPRLFRQSNSMSCNKSDDGDSNELVLDSEVGTTVCADDL